MQGRTQMRRFVKNNKILEGVVCKTENTIIQEVQRGRTRKRCYIIGNGHSLSVDGNNHVVKHDPLMHEFKPEISEEYTVYAFYFTFECSGLEESSREIAKFVNDLQDCYEEIFLVGHSKCGLCVTNAVQYCKKQVILVTISAPFLGTIMADKKRVEAVLKFTPFIKIYNMIFSDHNVDRDIAPNSAFIKNIRPSVCERHINIIASLEKTRDCRSVTDVFLLFVNKLMKINGDGIVSRTSQKATSSTRTMSIFSSHANSLQDAIAIIDKL